jgi:hypothetical protein
MPYAIFPKRGMGGVSQNKTRNGLISGVLSALNLCQQMKEFPLIGSDVNRVQPRRFAGLQGRFQNRVGWQ